MLKKKILFQIIKTLNPIDLWDYKVIEKLSIFDRILFIIKSFYRFSLDRNIGHLKFGIINIFLLIKHFMLNIFAVLFLPFAIILYFFNFKFLHVSYWQIGTLAFQVDILIKQILIENKNINLKKIIFICPKNYDSNIGITDLYKKKITVIQNTFIGLFLMPFLQIPKITINPYFIEHNIPYSKSHKIYSEYEEKIDEPLFHYTVEEKKYYDDILNKKIPYFKDKKIICIHLRNENFYKESGLTSRNADFSNYKDSINFLEKKGFFIIKFTDKISSFKSDNFFELTTNNLLDKRLQVYLVSKCEFFIVTPSGPSFLANLFKKPSLCTNFFPHSQIIGYNKMDITIPKKVFSKLTNTYLTFSQIFSDKTFLIASARILEKYNLEVQQNSSESILEGVKEMLINLNKNSNEPTTNQINFKNIVSRKAGCFYGQGQVSQAFLTKNSDIIK
jgi:putative glycosyltransferase (TIGR04372 family)